MPSPPPAYSGPAPEYDSDDDMVSMSSDEFNAYFQVVPRFENKLYHSSPTCPYPFPVDAYETQRLDVVHNLLLSIIGRPFVGPVHEILTAAPNGQERRVVDVGCGRGQCVHRLETMSDLYHHVSFFGLDIVQSLEANLEDYQVPISTRYPPDNVNFEIHDIATPMRFQNASIDVVHVRLCSMTVRNYNFILREASRVLRPGGILVFGEIFRGPVIDPSDGRDPQNEVPNLAAFYNNVNHRLQARGIQHVCNTIPQRLQGLGTFTDITQFEYNIPIGPWPNTTADGALIGRQYRDALGRYMDAAKRMLTEGPEGLSEQQYQDLCDRASEDIGRAENAVKLLTRYYTGFAIRG
ncbi:S-adenosyl-L-methionine-dependent methyltransferase [Cylindrobasidium torrendii FP15055 ss-10]|uniref:S-adenosyl-L-methionine-dependent methyltransferase n=1 Tax=Cylindrobasidium torrendii FP15055 ss-10 TaxID=1314674 RepID=A0A0D7BNV1_9AGAR|nr:S-adenosyl-L-methionine-dependent methyltransferase [Cylindrobasidium torrendii FP15055 ss-10]